MTLQQLKTQLDLIYGFDISTHLRKRKMVCARKVFINLAHNYGYTWSDITPVIDQKHDTCIYHKSTFSSIRAMDLHIYNNCIDYFNLPLQQYYSVSAIDQNPVVGKIVDELTKMGRKDVKYFNEKVFNPFIRNLRLEKSIMSNGSGEND